MFKRTAKPTREKKNIERTLNNMRIEKNDYDKLYPYTIIGAWDGKICCDKEDLIKLKKEIEKVLTND